MLFDLRSPRRRRFIKVIYASLAILMGGGLVLFGIGSDATGGLSSIFEGDGGGGGSIEDTVQEDIDAAEEALAQNPRNQEALIELVTLYSQAGRSQVALDEQTGFPEVTTDARESFNSAADAWARYLKINPKQPDTGAAIQMAQAFFLLAQNSQTVGEVQANLKDAARAQQVLVSSDPGNVDTLTNLAFYQYLAGEFGEADSTKARALAAAKGGERRQVTNQLNQAERNGRQLEQQAKREAKQGAQEGGNPLESLGGPGGLGGDSLGGF